MWGGVKVYGYNWGKKCVWVVQMHLSSQEGGGAVIAMMAVTRWVGQIPLHVMDIFMDSFMDIWHLVSLAGTLWPTQEFANPL